MPATFSVLEIQLSPFLLATFSKKYLQKTAQALGISKSHAYKIVRELNRDLKNAGYIVIAGKIPKAYWEQKFYGGSNHAS